MTKPKNPVEIIKRGYSKDYRRGYEAGYQLGLKDGKEIGLRDGDTRLARALRKKLQSDIYFTTPPTHVEDSILEWLTDRQKSRRKEGK